MSQASADNREVAPGGGEGPPRLRHRWAAAVVAVVAIAMAVAVAGQFPRHGEPGAEHYGVWSILPPVVAIVLAFWTRSVIVALFLGIVVGGVISGEINVVQAYLIPSIGTTDYALILLVYLWALGGMIGLWTRTGGAIHFAHWASGKMVHGPRTAKLFAWVMGLVFHQGGTISTVLTGATVRPTADRHKVSHEELSYIVDSTASPAATLIPFNVWPLYVAGLVVGTAPVFATRAEAVNFFFQAIPFNFYAIFALLFTLLVALEKMPWVPGRKLREAIERSRATGKLDRDGAEPLTAAELTEPKVGAYRPGLIDFFGPIGTLLGVAIIPYLFTYFVLGWREEPDPLLPIAEAFGLAVLAAIGIALVKGMPLVAAMSGFIDGCKGVTIGAVVLGLAITLKSVAESVGTAPYVIELAGGWVVPAILPALLMFACMFIAFSTGTSFGTFAVVFPVAMPLAWEVAPDRFFITLCFAAVTGGSLFGDQCSPISDTTILSSLGTGCDLMDHVYTQMPLALTAAGLGAVLYTLLAVVFV